jgi:hypothetical protein
VSKNKARNRIINVYKPAKDSGESVYREIIALSAMVYAINKGGFRFSPTAPINTVPPFVRQVVERLREFRRNSRGERSHRTYAEKEKQNISLAAGQFLSEAYSKDAYTTYEITVGGRPTAHMPDHIGVGRNRRSRTVRVTVGYQWRHKCLPLMQFNKLTEPNLFVLSAQEFRINAPMVRIYEAKVFNMNTGTMRTGFIGQTKIGKQQATFRSTAQLALNAATKLASQAVSAKLGLGEPENE